MKIKGLDIQTHGNLSGLKIDPLDDRLHIVETGTEKCSPIEIAADIFSML